MSKIQLLDTGTVNKIAAGEVVERPGSIVKELIENSIDAGADTISVEIKDGGISYIKVTDNGCGIEPDDVRYAFINHSTSKITSIEDLESVISLGFRGEALSSIASVSQVELLTKTRSSQEGTCLTINGGEIERIDAAGCADGTQITVKNIFYNVPARRKFLKKPGTESGYISDVINRIALAHPEISFKYINNQTTILHTPGNNDLKAAFFSIYGKDAASKMLDINFKEGDLSISGLIGKPELARANRSYENLFINGRYIKNELVSSAVEEAYKTRLLIGKFPVYAINLQLSPQLVDVNVHPAKLEVRFSNEDAIYNFVFKAITKTFENKTLIPQGDWESKPSPEAKKLMVEAEESAPSVLPADLILDKNSETADDKSYTNKPESENNSEAVSFLDSTELTSYKTKMYENKTAYNSVDRLLGKSSPATLSLNEPAAVFTVVNNDVANKNTEVKAKKEAPIEQPKLDCVEQDNVDFGEKKYNTYKIIGQIFNTYWIIEQSGSIYVIDQHAAHERILFEQLMESFRNSSVASQGLLEPLVINLTMSETEILKENKELIESFGFNIEEFGENIYALRGVPYIFKNPTGGRFLTEIIDMLGDRRVKNIYDAKVHSIATMACKAAVKGNDKLSVQEAAALVEKLMMLKNPFTCPHGRPTIIEMTKYELEKKFKRIQN